MDTKTTNVQLDKNTNRLSYKVGLLIKMVLVCWSFAAGLKLTEAVKSGENSQDERIEEG